MRLTLRTLLAWLDDAPMSQAQRKELKEKVVSSESARKLLEHLKAVESNRQIVAPQIDGQGNKDANVTGEYLDGVLDEALVAQFEKSCLQSDSLLAEVAGVHSALAAILRQDTIKITSSMRERSYKIGRVMARSVETSEYADSTPNSSDSSISHGTDGEIYVDRKLQNDSEFDLTPPDDDNEKKVTSFMEHLQQDLENISEEDHHTKPKLSDSQPKSNLPKILVIGLAAIVLVGAGIGIGILLQQNDNNSVAKSPDTDEATNSSDGIGPDESNNQNVSDEKKVGDQPGGNSQDNSEDENKGDVGDQTNQDINQSTGEKDNSANPGNVGDANTEAEDSSNEASESGNSSEPLANSNDETTRHTPSDLPPLPIDLKDVESKANNNKTADVAKAIPDRAEWPITQIPNGAIAGVAAKDDQILLRKADSNWEVLGADQEIRQGDVMFAPRGFRPVIAMPTANAQLIGPARITMGPAQTQESPAHMFVYSGRVMLRPALEAGDSVRLTMGDHTGMLVFTDQTTVVAVSVDRKTEFRNDTFFEKSVVVRITSVNGRAIWKDTKNNTLTIDPNNVTEYVGTEAPTRIAFNSPPGWLPGDLSKIDQDASVNIRQAMGKNVNPVLQLESFLTDARIENRYLAARALASWQRFRGMFQLLDDRTNKTYWTRILDDLRMEISSFESSAASMQQYLNNDPEGKLILELVTGFDDKQLAAGGDAKLVGALSNNRLLIRVLAIENLRRITGATFLYRPESQEKTRAKYVRQWRRELDRGEIRHSKE